MARTTGCADEFSFRGCFQARTGVAPGRYRTCRTGPSADDGPVLNGRRRPSATPESSYQVRSPRMAPLSLRASRMSTAWGDAAQAEGTVSEIVALGSRRLLGKVHRERQADMTDRSLRTSFTASAASPPVRDSAGTHVCAEEPARRPGTIAEAARQVSWLLLVAVAPHHISTSFEELMSSKISAHGAGISLSRRCQLQGMESHRLAVKAFLPDGTGSGHVR
jgi:hypothetical protein